MKRLCIYIFSLCLFLLLSFEKFAENTCYVSARDYYPFLMEKIKQTRKSIDIALYLLAYDENDKSLNIKNLLNALLEAKNRGVEIKVILDYKGVSSWKFGARNYQACEWFKKNQIPVFLDSPQSALHSKVVIFDKTAALIGSSNWSNAAFEQNEEASVFTDNLKTVEESIAAFQGIRLFQNKLSNPENTHCFTVPDNFIAKNGILLKLFTRQADKTTDLLLYLLAYGIDKNYAEIAEIIFPPSVKPDMGKKQIKRSFKFLEKEKILKIKSAGKEELEFEWMALTSNPNTDVSVPEDYFKYGWNKRLSHAGKIALLVLLKELREYQDDFVFFTMWEKKYGIPRSFQQGRNELKKYEILEVVYSDSLLESSRKPSSIQFRGLYDMDARLKELKDLEEKAGTAAFTLARRRAEIIFDAYNMENLQTILKLMSQYPQEALEYAFKTVKSYSPDNPRQSLKYIIGILKNPEHEWNKGEKNSKAE